MENTTAEIMTRFGFGASSLEHNFTSPYLGAEYFINHTLPPDIEVFGKSVLEIFSGDENNSHKKSYLNRGAKYTSLDKWEIMKGDHLIADAKRLPFMSDSFDFIVMSGPPFWGRFINKPNGQRINTVNPNTFIPTLQECFRVVKDQPKSVIAITNNFSPDDFPLVREFLEDNFSNFIDKWEFSFKESKRNSADKPNYSLMLVRK